MLAAALADIVGAPLTEIQTVEQMKAAPATRKQPDAEIPPELQEQLVHAMLDKQYRALLDEPVPMLGNVSPRAAGTQRSWASERRCLAEGHREPLAQRAQPDRSDGDLRFHLAVAGTEAGTTAELMN